MYINLSSIVLSLIFSILPYTAKLSALQIIQDFRVTWNRDRFSAILIDFPFPKLQTGLVIHPGARRDKTMNYI